MKPPHRSPIVLPMTIVAVLCVASGCDSPNPSPVEQSIAQAALVEDPEKKALQALEAKERAERAERAATKEREQAAQAAEIDAAALLPEVVPTDVAAACDAAVESYDAFMKAGAEKDALLWHDGRRKKLAERRATCITQANPTVAACQSKALLAPLPTLAGLERTEAANRVFARCADKFGARG